jgi:hypothetical protein
VKKYVEKELKKYDEKALEKHECIYDCEDREHNDETWGKHLKDPNHFPNARRAEVKVVCPKEEAEGQKRIPGRNFVGGHYVSDRW